MTRFAMLVRILAAAWGLAAVVAVVAVTPGSLRWWTLGLGVALVTFPAVRRNFGFLEPWVIGGVLAAAIYAAVGSRLPLLVAALLGIFLLGYAFVSDLADTLDHGALGDGGLPAWAKTLAPSLLAGGTGVLVVGGALASSTAPLAPLVIAGPVLLLLAVTLILGRRFMS